MTLEQKVDAIEGEIGIMKGEIKQTLVDLREFIMKQGSPFEGGGAVLPSAASQTAASEALGAEGASRVQQVFMDQEEGEDGGRSDDADSATEEARASAARMREELDAVRAESQRELEAMRAEMAAQARAAQAMLREELEAMRAERAAQPQPVQPPPQAPQVVQLPEGAVISGEPQVAEPELGAGVEAATGEEIEGLSGQVPGASALDANLLANLLKWVGALKRRLGNDQLGGLLEIYKLTGHLPPVVENLIYHLAALEALPDESSDQIFTVDDLMDSLLQLHAIVYGPGYPSRAELLDIE